MTVDSLLDLAWHGCRLNQPGWTDPCSRVLSFTLGGFDGEPDVHVIANMETEALDFELPQVGGRKWYRAVDTALPDPDEIAAPDLEVASPDRSDRAMSHSVVVLVSRRQAAP
jgi:isoamylase